MKNTLISLICVVLVAGCQMSPTSNSAEPFAKTRQPVPEAQFKNGVATAGSAPAPAGGETPDTKKVISRTLPSTMNVIAVVVDAKNAKKGIGAAYSLHNDRVANIADQIITEYLEKYDNDTAEPVVVNVTLEMLYLAGDAGILLGSTNSGVRGKLGVYNTRTSEIFMNGVAVNAAGSRRLPGLLGGVQVEGQEREMVRVSTGLAEAIRKRMFGG